MKTIRIYVVWIFIASQLVVSCDKEDDVFMSDAMKETESLNQKAGLNESRTLTLVPEGAEFDTQNFVAAIEQCKSLGSGAEIILGEGIFYLDKIDIYEFNGTIRGAGREKTIIKPIPGGINLPVYEPTNDVKPYFICFYGGSLIMKDLAFVIDEDNPIKPYEHWSGEGYLTIMGTIIWVNGNDPNNFKATSKFENVEFTGKMVNLFQYSPYNVDNCIIFGGSYQGRPLKGNHIIQNCYFNTVEAAALSMGGKNSTIIIGGCPMRGNTLNDVNGGFFLMDGDKMNFIISHNKMHDVRSYAGIWISQNSTNYFSTYIEAGKCRFLITDNDIHIIGLPYGDGVLMNDWAGVNDQFKKSSYQVMRNHFTLTGGEQTAVFSYRSFNAKIIGNKIEGTSEHGIGLWGQTADWHIAMNKFNNYECTWYDIAMGPLTHDNTVIGDNQTTVLDISGNNHIINPGIPITNRQAFDTGPRNIHCKFNKILPPER